MNQEVLLAKVNDLLHKDYTYRTQLETVADLVDLVERQQNEYISLSQSIEEMDATIQQYQLQETFLLERLKKQTLQIKEMKQNSRLIRFYDMAEENLKMAQELQKYKEMIGANYEQCQRSNALS
jgi:uncharacterized protein YqgV (UPF0045/DUF77 family)